VQRHSLIQGDGRECHAVVEVDVENFAVFVDGLTLAKQVSPSGDPAVETFTLKSFVGELLQ
jgi:hypothetical protein